MPQMKPMNWIILYLMINSLFFIFLSLIYYNKKNILINKNNYIKKKYLKWMW